jgi:hypothetical protein
MFVAAHVVICASGHGQRSPSHGCAASGVNWQNNAKVTVRIPLLNCYKTRVESPPQCSAVSAVFAELRAQGRLQLQAVDEQALLQVIVDLHKQTCCHMRRPSLALHVNSNEFARRLWLVPTKQPCSRPLNDVADTDIWMLVACFTFDMLSAYQTPASRQPVVTDVTARVSSCQNKNALLCASTNFSLLYINDKYNGNCEV